MLQKASDDGAHGDVLGNTGNSRAQRADAADDEIDLHARHRSLIQHLYDLRLDQSVEFRNDARGFSLSRKVHFTPRLIQ